MAQSTLGFIGLVAGDYEIVIRSSNTLTTESIPQAVGLGTLVVNVPEEVVILEGSSTTLEADIDATIATTFGWWIDQEALCPDNCLSVLVTPPVTTTYTFILENDAGCMVLDSTRVIVNSDPPPPPTPPVIATEIYKPNIFSPAESGDNSTFKLFAGDSDFNYEMEIYDRYGNLVFTGDESMGWDGTYRGTPAEPGLYVYKLTIPFSEQLGTQVSSGSFVLIR